MSLSTLQPVEPRASYYNISPSDLKMRAVDLPGLISIRTKDLFPIPETPVTAASPEAMCDIIRTKTIQTLEKVNLERVRPNDSVNILTSHHGYSIYGGHAMWR